MVRYRLDGGWEHQEQLPDLRRSRVANVHLEPCLAERHNIAEQDRRNAERPENLPCRLLRQFGYQIEQLDDEEERQQILVLNKETCSCALPRAARRSAMAMAPRSPSWRQTGR